MLNCGKLLSKVMASVTHYISTSNEWLGKVVCWLALLLVLEVSYSVVSRYAFDAPVIWHYDVTYMLYGSIWVFGCAYATLVKRHIRIDIFYVRLSARRQAILDIIGYVVFFFPVGVVVFYTGLQRALLALSRGEFFQYSVWMPIAFPFRMVLPVAMFFMLLQGVVELVSRVHCLREGKN